MQQGKNLGRIAPACLALFVHKTAILKELVDDSRGRQFFIARPRRFGKSLAVSTLKCLFEGKRDLFKGLAIEPLWDWSKKWPVIHLDMGSAQTRTVPELERFWRDMLKDEAKCNGVKFRDDENPSIAFKNLINDLYYLASLARRKTTAKTGDVAAESDEGQVVVLIDEYDKPILEHLMTPQVTEFNSLKFPNMEVENSFLVDLSALYIGTDNSGSANIAAEVVNALPPATQRLS